MKTKKILSIFLIIICVSCGKRGIKKTGELIITFTLSNNFSTIPNCALWIENESGKLVKTLYVSNKVAENKNCLKSEAGLPKWWEVKDKENIDGITGASPKFQTTYTYVWDLKDKNGNEIAYEIYVYKIETTEKATTSDTIAIGKIKIDGIPKEITEFEGGIYEGKIKITSLSTKYKF